MQQLWVSSRLPPFSSRQRKSKKEIDGCAAVTSRAASIKKSTKKNDYFFSSSTNHIIIKQFHFVEERAFKNLNKRYFLL